MRSLPHSPPPRAPGRVVRAARATWLALIVAGAAAVAACVLADPPAEVSDPPARRLRIVRESSSPPVTEILRTWPGTFHVVIEADPGATLNGYAFLDYDPASRTSAQDPAIRNLISIDDAGQRVVDVTFIPPDPSRCHTVEILLATSDFTYERTPAAGTSDSVVWFYSPTGDVTACAPFDGGLQLLDAAADASTDARRGD